MNTIILNMLKALPMPLLIEVFLGLAEEFVKRTDNNVDDAIVMALRAAFPKQP